MSRQNIIAVRLGELAIVKGVRGATPVFTAATVYDAFQRTDRPLDEDGRWVSYGPATDYRAVITATEVRVGLPDTLTQPTEAISHMRCALGTAASDDGYLQFRVSSKGDASGTTVYQSAVWAKVDEGFTVGVGLAVGGGYLTLMTRSASSDTTLASFGNYSVGDVLRMEFSGNTYTIFCNSQQRGTWTDTTSQVVSDEAHRSLGLRVHGAHAGNGPGPRSFSPTLDYVELG